MLEIQSASFSYGTNKEKVFQDVSLEVEPGRILCILGPNGIGKSTLLKCIAGLLSLQGGHILIGGKDISRMPRKRAARLMAYVPQAHQPMFSFSVLDVVLMGRNAHLGLFASPSQKDLEIALEAISALGLEHLTNKPYTEISGGERQLILIARVLAQQAGILLLDEPTSHLDFGNQVQILSLIDRLAELGLIVIMTTHFPDHAFMVSHRVALMHQGGLAALGSPEDIITEEILRRVYGVEIKIMDYGMHGRVCVPVMQKNELIHRFFQGRHAQAWT